MRPLNVGIGAIHRHVTQKKEADRHKNGIKIPASHGAHRAQQQRESKAHKKKHQNAERKPEGQTDISVEMHVQIAVIPQSHREKPVHERATRKLAKNRGKLEKKLYAVPEEIDSAVALLKLKTMGISIDTLTDEQKEYLSKITGVSVGSDAFFPFGDNIERARKSGVSYIAEPGGSIRDDNVIAVCDKYNMAMAFTHMRLFHH